MTNILEESDDAVDLELHQISFIENQLKIVREYNLEAEVIYYALKAMKEDPTIEPGEAFIFGVLEWIK